jgi:hypothetical protein
VREKEIKIKMQLTLQPLPVLTFPSCQRETNYTTKNKKLRNQNDHSVRDYRREEPKRHATQQRQKEQDGKAEKNQKWIGDGC